jgi:hypothetical protein
MQTMHSLWGMEDVLLKSDGSGNNDISDDANAKANATVSHALCLVCQLVCLVPMWDPSPSADRRESHYD